jgi:RES domain-containing protein
LELLVHTEDISTIHNRYSVIPVDFDEQLLQTVDPATLPSGWDAPEPIPETQMMGDTWVTSGACLVLQVPSAVTPGEMNYLINPLHSDFPKLSRGAPVEFQPDTRLLPED